VIEHQEYLFGVSGGKCVTGHGVEYEWGREGEEWRRRVDEGREESSCLINESIDIND
jgi:hypothetical protein